MNRRSFFKTLATAAAAFTVLPSATTYARASWKKSGTIFRPEDYMGDVWVINPEWANAPYEIAFISEPGGVFKPVYENRWFSEVFPEHPETKCLVRTPMPIRFREPTIPIPPYIKLTKPA